MSKLETNTIDNISGSSTLTIGDSNTSTITLKSGATLTNFPDNTPNFRAYSTSVQTIPTATQTKIQYNSENFDTDNCYDNTTNYRFTPTEAGTYFITASVRIDDGSYSNNNTQIYIYKNNSTWSRFSNEFTSASSPMISISDIVNLNGSSDYVEIFLYQSTGGDINLRIDTQNMYFSGYKLIGA